MGQHFRDSGDGTGTLKLWGSTQLPAQGIELEWLLGSLLVF